MEKDILIPEKVQVLIADKKYYIGELSVKQFLKTIKLLTSAILSSQIKLKQLKENSLHSATYTSDILSMIDLLDEKDLYKLIGCILNEDDIDFIEKNCTGLQVTNIIAIVCENNNFDILKKNVNRIIAALKNPVKEV